MSYRSPFRDVAEAFSTVAPNIAQGVANRADRRREEDQYARTAAERQVQTLIQRLGELKALNPQDEKERERVAQNITLVTQAMNAYQNILTLEPGKAYQAFMNLGKGTFAATDFTAGVTPRERDPNRPPAPRQQFTVPEILGQSAGTVSSSLLNAEERKSVRNANSEIVLQAYRMLTSGSLDLSNPLISDQLATIMTSVEFYKNLEVNQGVDRMRDDLPRLVAALRTTIMQDPNSAGAVLRDLAMQTAQTQTERAILETESARANLTAQNIELSFLRTMREQDVELRNLNINLANENIRGLSFANSSQQVEFFTRTGLTGTPEQTAALRAMFPQLSQGQFDTLAQDRFTAFKLGLQREETRANLEIDQLQTAIDNARSGESRANAFDEARLLQMQQDLDRGEFVLEREEWMLNRDKSLSHVQDATSALSYVMQATQQGDAAALNMVLREMRDSSSSIGDFYRNAMDISEVERRYRFALTDEDLREKDQGRRAQLSDIQYEIARTAAGSDLLAAGVQFGQWAAQSMTESELAIWHAEQMRLGRAVPPLDVIQLQRAAHMMTLQNPVKQELWSRIEMLAAMPIDFNNPAALDRALGTIDGLLRDPALGLSPEIVETYLNGFVTAQQNNYVGFNAELEANRLRSDLLRAQIGESYVNAQQAMVATTSGGGSIAGFNNTMDTLIGDAETTYDATRTYVASLEAIVQSREEALIANGCREPGRITTDTMGVSTSMVSPNTSVNCVSGNAELLEYRTLLAAGRVDMSEALATLQEYTAFRAAINIPEAQPTPAPTPAPSRDSAGFSAATGNYGAPNTVGTGRGAAVVPTPAPAAAAAAAPAAAAPAAAAPAAAAAAAPAAAQAQPASGNRQTSGTTNQAAAAASRIAGNNTAAAASLTTILNSGIYVSWARGYSGPLTNNGQYASPYAYAMAIATLPYSQQQAARNDLYRYVYNNVAGPAVSAQFGARRPSAAQLTAMTNQILTELFSGR